MTPRRLNGNRGATTIEFTLVGIPIVFILVCIFEISRGMWMYETVAHAVRQGARFAAVHGQDCSNPPNACDTLVKDIAQQIQNAGVGLDPSGLQITVNVLQGGTTNSLVSDGPQTLTSALSDAQDFSGWTFKFNNGGTPTNVNASGPGNDVQVFGSFPFHSALAFLWPTQRPVKFAQVILGATSRERIVF